MIARCNSSGELYPFHPPSTHALTAVTSSDLWHRRLGHLGHEALTKLASTTAIPCTKNAASSLCHACQLSRHVRLPFSSSNSRASHNFDLVHCDLWTSPVASVLGYKYYLVILDGCSHFLWTFPLRLKSETFSTLSNFFNYVRTQFGSTVKSIQCDNGREFDNSSARHFFLLNGIALRMSCPYTSQQNGKAERFAQQMMCFGPSSSRCLCPRPTGLKPFMLRPISLTSSPPKHSPLRYLSLLSMASTRPTPTCVFLAVNAILTYPPLPRTNWHLDSLFVSFSATLLNTKAIAALTCLATVCSSLAT